MNENEMIEDKEQMARIIAFDLCPKKYHKEWYGEGARCYADNNFGDCAKIKEVVDKLYNAHYRKVADDEIVVKKGEYEVLLLEQKLFKGTVSRIPCGHVKIADDEIVIKKRQYEQLKKYNRDRKRLRLKWQQAKQEKREILQAINKYLVGTRGIYTIKTFRNCRFEDLMLVRADDLETLVNKLAKEHDVELEE